MNVWVVHCFASGEDNIQVAVDRVHAARIGVARVDAPEVEQFIKSLHGPDKANVQKAWDGREQDPEGFLDAWFGPAADTSDSAVFYGDGDFGIMLTEQELVGHGGS